MNRKRLILYLIFAVYQIISFIFTVMVDGHLDLLGLLKFIPAFKFVAAIGVILILVDFVWYWMDNRANRRKLDEQAKENDTLKARIYDYQEAEKRTGPTKPV
jgi:cell shape-determining protein MreC